MDAGLPYLARQPGKKGYICLVQFGFYQENVRTHIRTYSYIYIHIYTYSFTYIYIRIHRYRLARFVKLYEQSAQYHSRASYIVSQGKLGLLH